ncbi:hypothetical protein [Nocardioides ferulae]|uniref:hypothetical protein n=1 Tax=Nocardioides ferulae TaxID=2340821 RepID=UPI0013DDD5A8|nr:hypothetical protein [Nocardioides ferulae]
MSVATLFATPSSSPATNSTTTDRTTTDRTTTDSTVHVWGTSTNLATAPEIEVSKREATPVTEGRLRNAVRGAAASGVLLAGLFGTPAAGATTSTTPVHQGPERRLPSRGGVEVPASPSVLDLRPIQLVEELKTWLGLADDGTADLVGVSRRSITNWRQGKNAYAASTERLTQVHALVSGLVRSLGDEAQVRLWLRASDAQGRDRLALLEAGEDGLRQVVNEAASLLFVTPTAPDFDAGLSDSEAAWLVAGARTAGSHVPGPARRVRKPRST